MSSSIDGPLQQRERQRDAAGLASQYTYTYTPDEMAAWLVWYRDTLLDGRRWFAHALPGPNGLMQRVVRYRSVQQQLLGVGIYRVSASFEQRGASLMPYAEGCDPNWEHVVLLLRSDGVDGGTTLRDVSMYADHQPGRIYEPADGWFWRLTSSSWPGPFGGYSFRHHSNHAYSQGFTLSGTRYATGQGTVPFTLEWWWRSHVGASNHTEAPMILQHMEPDLVQRFAFAKRSNANHNNFSYRVGSSSTVGPLNATAYGTGGVGIDDASHGAWHHVAYCSAGDNGDAENHRLRVNGEVVVAWNGGAASPADLWRLFLGAENPDSSATTTASNLQWEDMRLTIGFDRYPGSAMAIPPSAPLPVGFC